MSMCMYMCSCVCVCIRMCSRMYVYLGVHVFEWLCVCLWEFGCVRVSGCMDRMVVDTGGGADIDNLFKSAILCFYGADVHLSEPSQSALFPHR